MKLIKQWVSILQVTNRPAPFIEECGRVCYRSEDMISEDSADKFVKTILGRGHHSVIEHAIATLVFGTNRGVTHELVRHRLASYSQESTRYVDYVKKGEMEFILPVWLEGKEGTDEYADFKEILKAEESAYFYLRDLGWRPEQAREVLPNALSTKIVVTANLREWRHIFTLRCSAKAHPQIRSLMREALRLMHQLCPTVFEDIYNNLYLEEK